ncbi:MAG: trypsin-like peptidase domain-containing protein [Bdellovibrionales bacterium]
MLDWKTIFVTPILSLYTCLATAEPGFYTLAQAQKYPALYAAARNVLELWIPGAESRVSASEYTSRIEVLENQRAFGFEEQIQARINLTELRSCKTQRSPVCFLSQSLTRTSAFVVEGNILVTARHAFAPSLHKLTQGRGARWTELWRDSLQRDRVQWEIERFRRDPLSVAAFFVTDARGQLIFRSNQEGFRFLRLGPTHATQSLRGDVVVKDNRFFARVIGNDLGPTPNTILGYQNDLAFVELSLSLPSLQIARSGCQPGDPSFIIGYPARTEDRRALGYPDALDRELAWTRGEFLSLEQVAQRARHWPDAGRLVREAQGRPLVFSSADGNDGMSGGLIANANGEACGVFFGAWPGSQAPVYDASLGVFSHFSFGPALTAFRD